MIRSTTRIADRTAIVTGSAQGIGEAYAKALAAEGASVVVADIDTERGGHVAEQIVADGGTAVFKTVDVSHPGAAGELAAFTVETFGGIDHVVNNAAI